MQLSDFKDYKTALDKLHRLQLREKALEAEYLGVQSQLVEARSSNPREQLIDQLIENPEQVLAPSAVQALQANHEHIGRELDLVRRAVRQQHSNLRSAEARASKQACDQVRKDYGALVKQAMQQAAELAMTCEQARALTEELKQGGLSAATLPVVGLLRMTGELGNRYSTLRQLMDEAQHAGFITSEDKASMLSRAVKAGYVAANQITEVGT